MATDILPPERKEKSAYAAANRYATNVGTCLVVRSTSSRAAGASTRPSRFCRSLKPTSTVSSRDQPSAVLNTMTPSGGETRRSLSAPARSARWPLPRSARATRARTSPVRRARDRRRYPHTEGQGSLYRSSEASFQHSRRGRRLRVFDNLFRTQPVECRELPHNLDHALFIFRPEFLKSIH